MSLPRHASDDELDAATWCRHLVPDRSVFAFLADHRHQLFPPELFADLGYQMSPATCLVRRRYVAAR
jgi:hypothetical protein